MTTRPVAAAVKAYIAAQREIPPYEDAKLATITVQGDPKNPVQTVHTMNFGNLSDEQFVALGPLLDLSSSDDWIAPSALYR
jgi:hypothetical protein